MSVQPENRSERVGEVSFCGGKWRSNCRWCDQEPCTVCTLDLFVSSYWKDVEPAFKIGVTCTAQQSSEINFCVQVIVEEVHKRGRLEGIPSGPVDLSGSSQTRMSTAALSVPWRFLIVGRRRIGKRISGRNTLAKYAKNGSVHISNDSLRSCIFDLT